MAEEAPADVAPAESTTGEETSPLMIAFDEARQAFYDGNYDKALEKVNAALVLAKNDALLHEFRSLVLFAKGQYRDSAAAIHSVLAVGPGWDWTTLSGMYPSVDVYTSQLRKLEEFVVANPTSAATHFLLAYHYITCGSTQEAIAQLQEVNRLEPGDTVAVQVLEMIGGPSAVQQSPTTAPPRPAAVAAEAPAIPKQDLVGTWKAKGTGKSSFELKLTDADGFTWTYHDGEKTTKVEGVYAIEQNTLAMEPDAGGVMVAELTPPKGGKFHFQVVGGPPNDPGLDFAK
jgi:tetratricopeptide (TPR) repeat protein